MGEPAKKLKADNKQSIIEKINSLVEDIKAIDGEMLPFRKRKYLNAIQIGKLLIQQKKQGGRGNFLPWLKENVKLPEKTALDYKRLAEHEKEFKLAKIATLTDARNHLLNKPKGNGKERNVPKFVNTFINGLMKKVDTLVDFADCEDEIEDEAVREKLRESAEEMIEVCEKVRKTFAKKPKNKKGK